MQENKPKLLILGGTADARMICQQLSHFDFSMIYSVAGLVRTPNVPAEIVVGGFSQFSGLDRYCQQHAVNAIIDATHPYAQTMSETAMQVSSQLKIPLWRFKRPSWPKTDNIKSYQTWSEILSALPKRGCVFFTAGQLPIKVISRLQSDEYQTLKQLLRTAVKPKHVIADNMTWIKAIGPFSFEQEMILFQTWQCSHLVCKDSGGESTYAKLLVAKQSICQY